MFVVFTLVLSLVAAPAAAADEVRFASVSWTGVTIKTEIGVRIMEALGYESSNTMVSLPIVYKAMEMNDADIFLGNWMPSMATVANKFFERGTVVKYVANMPGAKYTLAAPAYVVDGGLKDFSDIARFADKLDHKIYGIEEGNDGNKVIEEMIEQDMFGLGDFELIPSSEAGMLAQVKAFTQQDKWVVFLGWAPHYMNEIIDMKYLTGSTAETFGENDGTATVYTNIRKGFDKENPNVANFLQQFIFPVSMMNEIMAMLYENDGLKPYQAGMHWVAQHPEIYRGWLEGVTTVDGEPALPAFERYLEEEKPFAEL
jgi:glycine betaine/proline transport system substrate-binding protein